MVHQGGNPDLTTICRLCLGSDAKVAIFGGGSVPLRIMTCLALEVSPNDALPPNLCVECRYQLEKSYYFRKRSQAKDNQIRKHIRLLTLGKPSRLFNKTDEEAFEDELEYEDSLAFLREEDERRELEKSADLTAWKEGVRKELQKEYKQSLRDAIKEELRCEIETELRDSLRMECVEDAKAELRNEMREECHHEQMQKLLGDLESFLKCKRSSVPTTETTSPMDEQNIEETQAASTDDIDAEENGQTAKRRGRPHKRTFLASSPAQTGTAVKMTKLDKAESTTVKELHNKISVVKYDDIGVVVDNSMPFSIVPITSDNDVADGSSNQFILQEDTTTDEHMETLLEENGDGDVEAGEDEQNCGEDENTNSNCDEVQHFYATEMDTFQLTSSGDSNHNKETTSYQIDISDMQFYKKDSRTAKGNKPNDEAVILLNFSECMDGEQYESMELVTFADKETEKDTAADGQNDDNSNKRQKKRLLSISSLSGDEFVEAGESEEANLNKIADNPQRQTDTAKTFKCDRCPSIFSTFTLLSRHTRSHERGEQQGIAYECPQCQLVLSCRSALTRHMIIHTGERPHQCPFCDKSFGQREVLKRHLNIHTGEKPYQCNVCQREFSQKANLTSHIRAAHSSKPKAMHACPLCTKKFHHASGLSRHLVTHNGVQFQCSKCERVFCDRSSVKRHIANIHGSNAVAVHKVEDHVFE